MMRRLISLPYMFIMLALLAAPSCKESATTLPSESYIKNNPNPPGYYYPRMAGFLPDTSPVPVNTSAAIIFNIPVNAPVADTDIRINSSVLGRDLVAGSGEYSLTVNDPGNITIVTITFSYGGINPLAGNDTVTVTILSSITDRDLGIPLSGSVTRTFTTGTAPDIIAPMALLATRNPINPAVVFLTDAQRIAASQEIHVDFDKQIDPASINSTTFLLSDGAIYVPANVTYNSGTMRATLTPVVNLDPSLTYTVTVRGGGVPYQSVRDLSNNYLAADVTWQFDTTNTPLDITPGVPPFLTGLYVDSVSDVDAAISWTTNEPADYTLNFGRGDDVTQSAPGALFSSFQSVTLALNTASDAPNARYWFNIGYQDIEGLPIVPVPTSTYQFNTASDEPSQPIDDGTGNQHAAHTLSYHPLNGSNTGFFIFWTNDSAGRNHLYSQLYDRTFPLAGSALWNGGSPRTLYTNPAADYSFETAVEDGVGGVIIVAEKASDTFSYAKHLNSAGAFLWGSSDTADGSAVRSADISSVSAVPVYTGSVRRVTAPGVSTAEMGTWLNHLNNSLFDDITDLTGVADTDIVANRTTHAGAAASRIGGDNFDYMVGLASNIFAAGNVYHVGDGVTNLTTGFSVVDHTITATNAAPVPGPYTSGGTTFYTDHSSSFWTAGPPAWLGSSDIVGHDNNATFGLINNLTELTPVTSIKTGAAGGGGDNLFVWFEWWGGVSINDYVLNDDNGYSQAAVTAINAIPFTLTLAPAGMSFASGDTYHIYDRYCNGHTAPLGRFFTSFYQIDADWGINITTATTASLYNFKNITGAADARPAVTGPLYDNDATFDSAIAPLPVIAGDIVINYTSGNVATVTAATWSHALEMGANIMTGSDPYEILRLNNYNTSAASIVTAGTANADDPSHLRSANTFAGVAAGDIAYNLTDDTYAMITAVAANNLTLSWDAFDTGTERYVIFHRRGVLYVWQEGASIRGRIMSMETPQVQLQPDPAGATPEYFPIATGTNPRAISDGYGNAIVIYVDVNELRAVKLNGAGAVLWNNLINTEVASGKTLIDVQGDGAGGAVVLYKYANDLHAQRINGSGAAQWGANGRLFDNDGAGTVTSDEVMTYLSSGDDVIAAATVNTASVTNDVWVSRRGATNWVSQITTNPVTPIPGDQVRPQIYNNGTDLIVAWDDSRFYNQSYINTGYGIFGMRLSLGDGQPASATVNWSANTSGTDDYYGSSIILNSFNLAPGYPIVVPYDNGAEATIIWEDFRAGEGGDILYRDLGGFAPPL